MENVVVNPLMFADNICVFSPSINRLQQERIQPVTLGGAYFEIKSHKSFATIREMKYASQNCCDNTIDKEMTLCHECCFPSCTKSW